MTVEIVTHCYRYATLLKFQLSSLVLWPPEEVAVVMTVFHTAEDEGTVQVLDDFGAREVPGVRWNWKEQPTLSLCRRSIGRNLAALGTVADWVWFTDADYWFSEACWAGFPKVDSAGSDLVHPKRIWIHKTHEMGDRCILAAKQERALVQADPDEFQRARLSRAIGGVQIVRGDWCRVHGYLPGHSRAQRPAKTPGFTRCVQDVVFRQEYGRSGSPPPRRIDLPGVYRIRHSRAGREVLGLEL